MVISASSEVPKSGFAGLLLPFIMEMAINKTKIPPPTWNEPTLMPRSFSKKPPVSAKTVMTMKTVSAATEVILRRSFVLWLRVKSR